MDNDAVHNGAFVELGLIVGIFDGRLSPTGHFTPGGEILNLEGVYKKEISSFL